jgi:two-component system, chemotaxis family, response regulator Rcp1
MTETTLPESLRILLVEDNAADARIMKETLREMPFPTQLEAVDDGEAALAFLRRYAPHGNAPRPDLILLDLHLPRKNGFEVLDEIYGDPELRTIPVVVCLGSVLDAVQLERYKIPTDCVFTKGYDPHRLLHVLTRCPGATKGCQEVA